ANPVEIGRTRCQAHGLVACRSAGGAGAAYRAGHGLEPARSISRCLPHQSCDGRHGAGFELCRGARNDPGGSARGAPARGFLAALFAQETECRRRPVAGRSRGIGEWLGEKKPMGKVAEMRVIVGDKEDPDRAEGMRILEALLFAAEAPLDEKVLASRLPAGIDAHALLQQLQREYAPRGVNLVRIGGKWTLPTATDLAWLLTDESVVTRKLSRAAIETLAIVAYHQPVTRAEVEEIRGVSTSKGTLDVLLETGWIRLRGRRKAP